MTGSHLFIFIVADDLAALSSDAKTQRSVLRLSTAKILVFAQHQAHIQQNSSLEYDFDLWQSAMLHLPLFGPAVSSEETAEMQIQRGSLSAWTMVLQRLFIGKDEVVEKTELSHFVEKQAMACMSQTTSFEIITFKMISRALDAKELVGTIECVSTSFTLVGDSKPRRSVAIPIHTKRLIFELNRPLQPAALHVLDGADESIITASEDYLELHAETAN